LDQGNRKNKNFYNDQMRDLMNRYGDKSNISRAKDDKVEDKLEPQSRIKKTSQVFDDLKSINELNITKYRNRSVRNRVLIVILAVFLILSITVVCVMAASIHRQNNVFLYTHGNCSAKFYIDDMPLDKFRTPSDIRGDIRLDFDVDLDIESFGEYNIKFIIRVYENDKKLKNLVYHEPNKDLFIDGKDGYLYSKSSIKGGTRIDIVQGVYIDYDYKDSLNINNFRMEIHVYLEKV